MRDLALAAIAARVTEPESKRGTARALSRQTAMSNLGVVPEIGATNRDEMLTMLDWLAERQP